VSDGDKGDGEVDEFAAGRDALSIPTLSPLLIGRYLISISQSVNSVNDVHFYGLV